MNKFLFAIRKATLKDASDIADLSGQLGYPASVHEIGGLIVSELFRGRGIGRALVTAAEEWAGQKNCSRLRVRTRIAREQAKNFYSKIGFSVSKQQHVFDKIIKERGKTA